MTVNKARKINKAAKNVFSRRLNNEIKEVYTGDDVPSISDTGHLGMPGKFPYTRGIHPRMYRERPWIMRELTAIVRVYTSLECKRTERKKSSGFTRKATSSSGSCA